jgi:hypothetical protein
MSSAYEAGYEDGREQAPSLADNYSGKEADEYRRGYADATADLKQADDERRRMLMTVRSESYEELDEDVMKKLGKMFKFVNRKLIWLETRPEEVIKYVRNAPDDVLKRLYHPLDSVGADSPASLQQKAIRNELMKRFGTIKKVEESASYENMIELARQHKSYEFNKAFSQVVAAKVEQMKDDLIPTVTAAIFNQEPKTDD